MFLINWSV